MQLTERSDEHIDFPLGYTDFAPVLRRIKAFDDGTLFAQNAETIHTDSGHLQT